MYNPEKSKAVAIISILAIILGVSVVLGWVFNLPGLETIFPQYDSMKFNTASCFILLGTALLLTQFESKNNNKLLILTSSALAALIGGLSLSQDIFHFNFGIDQLFIIDKNAIAEKYPFPGRMAANVSLCFLLFGLSMIGFNIRNRPINILSQYLLHLVTAISAVAIIGYLYGLSLFYKLTFIGSMAVHTAILFFFMSIIATLLHPSLGITNLFSGQLVGNKMARRIFVLLVLMVVIFGSLRVQSERYGILSTETGISLLAVCFLFVSLLIIWYTANYLNRIDSQRYAAEEEIRVMNEDLEERVEERSSELLNLLEKYKESESKFRAAFEYSPIGMVMVSIEDGRFLQVNNRLCEIVGYSEQELLSMTFLDITHPDDLGVHVDVRDSALKGEKGFHVMEKRYLCKNGSIVWVSVNLVTIVDSRDTPLYFVAQIEDITERKKAEYANDRIVENEERLRAIFDNVEGATSLLDTNMRLIVFNKVFREKQAMLTGREPRVGDELYGHLPPDEKKKRYEIVNRVLNGSKEVFEAMYTRDGKNLYFRISFAPVIVDGKVIAISSYSIDLTASKEADNKIRKSDARFRAIVESVFVGIKLNDAEGNIIYRSPSMQAINGWTDDEMNRNYFKLTHPDDLEMIRKVHGEVLSNPGKSINVTYRILHKNGYYIWIESLVCNKLSDPDLGAVITVTRDVTERKMVEDQLKKSEEKYHELIEHASDAIYLLDYKGNFIEVNESMCKMTGYTVGELMQLNIEQLIDPEQLKTDPLTPAAHNPKQPVIRERRFVNKDGNVFNVEINVKMFPEDRVLVIARDITERKRAEEVIFREKTLSETIINSLPEVFYLRNDKGEFLRWNKNFEKITGYSSEEIRTLQSRSQLAEEDQGKVQEAVEKMFKQGHATVEARIVTKYGVKVPFLITITPLIYENQQCVLGIAVDITSRLKAEDELRSSEQKYKLLFDSNPQPLSMIAKDDLSIIAVNEAFAKQYGYTKDEFLKLKATVLRPKEDLGQQLEFFKQDISGSADLGVVRHIRKDGTEIFVHIIAHDITFEGRSVRLSLNTDVTEKLKAEEKLQKSEANLKAIMDTTDTAYALLDKKLKIIAYNQMAIKFVNSRYNHTPANGDQLTDFLPEDRFPQFVKNADEVLKGKHINYEINYPQPGGSELWYYVKLFPITNDKQEIFGLMIAVSDITERKNAEESLRTAYNLIQDHISSIKDMAWKQSHLIRSPVANLKGLAALLEDDPANVELLQYVNIELERLDAVIIGMAEDVSDHDL